MDRQKIGLLLVNHGSHSPTWRQALLDLESVVREPIAAGGIFEGIKTAYMEYTEPSIASQMKAFDAEGFSDVVIVPIFLTVSSHSFDDIPTIVGQKQDRELIESLKAENIECYTPRAKTHITPLLDFTDVLQKNVLRRSRGLSSRPENEGLVLIGYGDAAFEKEWQELFSRVAEYVEENTGISAYSYGWCGHIVHYNPEETTKAINAVLASREVALVIPVLVAYDEMFQKNIIGRGIKAIENNEAKILYRPDSILPDDAVAQWVIRISDDYARGIRDQQMQSSVAPIAERAALLA